MSGAPGSAVLPPVFHPWFPVRAALRLWLRARSTAYLLRVRGRHRGRRGFIIGNGPSLRMEDLERLRGEICIASNKIFLAFEKTRWRPAYHTMADPLVIQKIGASLGSHVQTTHVPEHWAPAISGCRVVGLRYRGAAVADPARQIQFSDGVAFGLYGGYTVTFENLQLARHLGLDPVYLIGCDHYYQGEKESKPNELTVHGSGQTHFVPNYREKGEVSYAAPIESMTLAYRHAQAFAERSGWRVFNATRGGYLEVFPRADLDQVLASGGDPHGR